MRQTSCTMVILTVLAGGCAVRDPYLTHRMTTWGENYFDRTDTYEGYGPQILDLRKLSRLLESQFATTTSFYVNQRQTIDCAQVVFREKTYLLTRPIFVGSAQRRTQGFDFYIRTPDSPCASTDVMVSILWNHNRSLTSVVVDTDFGGQRTHKQFFTNDRTRFGAEEIAVKVRSWLYSSMGDDFEDDYWNYMPRFIEKLIFAVDNCVER